VVVTTSFIFENADFRANGFSGVCFWRIEQAIYGAKFVMALGVSRSGWGMPQSDRDTETQAIEARALTV
jgi:hypothetical protein